MTSNILVGGVPFSEIPPDTLFDPVRGVINPLIYADPGIYELELERVFGRSWLFICHDSHIPRYGDYFSTYMAEDPVIAVRQRDNSVRVLLNQCRHRGMKVCRSDAGNARAFTCTYHGWAYDLAGNLVSVPMQEMSFPPDFDRGSWGLRQPRVDSYKGLIFATWNADAPSLRDYLGDAAFYLDALVDRGPKGAVAIGGMLKWVIPCNWKFAAEQFASDMYHGDMSHMSAMLGAVKQATGEYERQPPPTQFGRQFSDPNSGHGTGFFVLPESNHPFRALQAGQTVPGFDPAAIHARQQAHSAPHSMMMAQHMTVFPTFSFFAGVNTVRTWHPRGPNEIEVWAFCMADADATPAEREQLRQASLRTFAPSGTWEQDDGENWVEIQRVLRGREARRTLFNAQMGMGRDFGQDAAYPNSVNQAYNEGSARGLYTRWRTLMTTPDERPVQLQGFAHAQDEPVKDEPVQDVLRAARVGAELQHEIEQFLFLEAQLLDAGEIAEWLTLLTDDVRYFMPIRTNRNPRERDREWTGAGDVALFDETKATLTMRLHKLNTGAAWAEEPRSHTRHLVTNVRIRPQADAAFAVQSSFLVYRNRAERQADLLVGERHDLLRRVDTPAGFVLASRRILLDQTTLLANNLSFFL